MSKRSYTSCFLHLVWGTYDHQPLLSNRVSREKLTRYFKQYSVRKGIGLLEIFINPEHVHLLIELPTNMTIEDIVKLIKGSSSHWTNQNDIIKPKFAWAKGYGAFTVSKSNVGKVRSYIKNQEEHHNKITFRDEYEKFILKHGLKEEN